MYLHLGSSVVIPQSDVLGIFDLDNTTSSRITRDFLAQAQRAGQVVTVGDDLPKSFTLCRDPAGRITVYLSQLSSATLLKRFESGSFHGLPAWDWRIATDRASCASCGRVRIRSLSVRIDGSCAKR